MATYADCARVQGEINALQREINALQRELNMMIDAISGARNTVSQAHGVVQNCLVNGDGTLKQGRNSLENAYKLQGDIEELNKRYKVMELSYKAIRSLKNKLRYAEGNNRKVSKVLGAILDNFNLGLVSDENMESVAEKLHLETQGFYLSYIMMSVILWKRDEKSAAERAMEKALQLNLKQSAVFYMLLSYKFGRYDAAAAWLDILLREDVTGGDEKLLIFMLLAAINPEVQANKSRLYSSAMAYIKKSQKGLKSGDKEILESLVKKLFGAAASPSGEYIHLKQYCPEDYAALKQAMSYAISNRDLLAFLENAGKAPEGRNPPDYLDRLLDSELENGMTPEIEKIMDEVRYHEEIINARGVVEDGVAQKAASDLKRSSNIVVNETLYKVVYETPEKFSGKEVLSRFAYKNIAYLHRSAYDKYHSNYHGLKKSKLRMKIDSYSGESDFKDAEKDEKAITAHYSDLCARDIKNSRKIWPLILCPLLMAAALAVIILSLAGVITGFGWTTVPCAVLIALGAVGIALCIVFNKRTALRLTEQYRLRTQQTINEYTTLAADYKSYLADFAEHDEGSKKIKDFLAA